MHPILRRRAELRLGVFTAAEARLAGYGQTEVRTLCTQGRWVRLRRGVYVTAETLAAAERSGTRHRVECVALLTSLDRPGAALSHGTAARLWGLPLPRRPETVLRLTDPAGWRRGTAFVVACAPLPPSDVVTRGPLRLTSVARTLADCAREWPLEDAVIAADAALVAERTDREALTRAVAAVRHWRGGPRAVRAAALADGRAESPLETRGRLRMVGTGLPAPTLQVEIRAAGRLVGVVDAWFEEAAVAVEFDGQVKYTNPWRGRTPERTLWDEKRREDALRALDVRVVRIADEDLRPARWHAVEDRLSALLAAPGPATRRFTATPRERGRLQTG